MNAKNANIHRGVNRAGDAKAPTFARIAASFARCTPRNSGDGYIRRLFPSLGRLVGIQKRVHPHDLRHTHAAQLRAEGIDVGIISKQLGHTNIATTARYLDHIAPTLVIQTIASRSW